MATNGIPNEGSSDNGSLADGVWFVRAVLTATRGTEFGKRVQEATSQVLGHLDARVVLECGFVIIENGDVSQVGWIVERGGVAA